MNSKICSDFKIQVQHDFEKSTITLPDAYDVGFIMNPLDDRGSYSSNLVKNNTNRVLEVEYDNDSLKISIDHTKVRLNIKSLITTTVSYSIQRTFPLQKY